MSACANASKQCRCELGLLGVGGSILLRGTAVAARIIVAPAVEQGRAA